MATSLENTALGAELDSDHGVPVTALMPSPAWKGDGQGDGPGMNIYAKEGDKVIFAYPHNGYGFDQMLAKAYLDVDREYVVERTEVDSFRTNVFLQGMPSLGFNSVMFRDAESSES